MLGDAVSYRRLFVKEQSMEESKEATRRKKASAEK